MKLRKSILVGLLAGAVPAPLYAQDVAPVIDQAPAEPVADPYDDLENDEDGEAIVVTGQRLRGAVVGDIPPEIQLDARDIRAYGASTISDLMDALAPQTSSSQGRGEGRPVMLVNGRRISGFSEIRDIPPEAIERIDILPEEVALKYGYKADQRVVNFVLRQRFRAVTGELEYGMATAGGRSRYEADLNVLRIDSAGRWSIDLDYEHQAPLFESERDIIQSPPSRPFDLLGNVTATTPGAEIDPALSALVGRPVTEAGVPLSAAAGAPSLGDFAASADSLNQTDLGRFRTLLAETHQFAVNGTLNRTIFGDVSATVNARFEETASQSRFGLPSATLTLPSANPFSPFASDVSLYRYVGAPGPLMRESEGRTGHVGLALNGDIAPWRWAATANLDRVTNMSRTDTGVDLATAQARLDAGDPLFNPFGPISNGMFALGPRDRSQSTNDSANAEVVLNGPVTELPAGPISASIRVGAETRSFDSETVRSGIAQSRQSSRDRANAQANLDFPIASRRRDVLAPIGDLSFNLNGEVEHLSDFGTLTTLGYGLNWSPIAQVRIIASVTDEDGAPSVQQLGDPTVLTPNVRVFDFLRGETVDITRLEGGNPGLVADNRRVMKLGLNVKPLSDQDLSISANYTSSRIRNPIASFPTATPEIEAAFPERFVRDASGRLLSIDSRPVNFARSDRQELRWGFNFSKPIKQSTPQRGFGGRRGAGAGTAPATETGTTPAPGVQPAAPTVGEGAQRDPGTPPAEGATPPADRVRDGAGRGRGAGGGGRGFGGGGRGFGGGGRGFGGGGAQGGRLQLALYHTWHLEDSILIRDGVPELDLLHGSAVGSRGGQSSHEIEAQVGLFKNGFGARLSANWQSGTTVRGTPDAAGGSTGDLAFSDFATLNLRLFADLSQQRSLVRKYRWLRGTRITLAVDNLLDSKLQVRDAAGATPLSYQPDYLDPVGRSIRVSVRKLFF